MCSLTDERKYGVQAKGLGSWMQTWVQCRVEGRKPWCPGIHSGDDLRLDSERRRKALASDPRQQRATGGKEFQEGEIRP